MFELPVELLSKVTTCIYFDGYSMSNSSRITQVNIVDRLDSTDDQANNFYRMCFNTRCDSSNSEYRYMMHAVFLEE